MSMGAVTSSLVAIAPGTLNPYPHDARDHTASASGRCPPGPLTENRPVRSHGPKRYWWGLSWRQRRQVLQLAWRCRVHPDPAISDAAHRWAVEVGAERLGWVAVGALFDSGMSWAERRAARNILRAETLARADDPLTSDGS